VPLEAGADLSREGREVVEVLVEQAMEEGEVAVSRRVAPRLRAERLIISSG
jgi:hypothetical protein